MKWTNLVCFAPLVAASPFAGNANPTYDGFHVYSVTPGSAQEARDLGKQFSRYHTHPIRHSLSIAVPPEEVAWFNTLELDARLLNEDLGSSIRAAERRSNFDRSLHKRGDLPDLSWFDTYHSYTDHLDYWDDLVHAFPAHSKKFEIGKSYENRSIYAFHLFGDKNGGYEKGDKPAILWHATVHAREVSANLKIWKIPILIVEQWISTMVIEYLAYQLIDGYKSGDGNVTAFLDYYDFYLVPFHNPDGQYTLPPMTPILIARSTSVLTFRRLLVYSDQRPPLAQKPTTTPQSEHNLPWD
jgi:hypothetical protein